jgi:hypothetical protein
MAKKLANGEPEHGMLFAFLFIQEVLSGVDEKTQPNEDAWEFDRYDVLDEDCTLEWATESAERHRAKVLASYEYHTHRDVKKGVPERVKFFKAVYQWMPYSAATRLDRIVWKEYPEDKPDVGNVFIRRLLG